MKQEWMLRHTKKIQTKVTILNLF